MYAIFKRSYILQFYILMVASTRGQHSQYTIIKLTLQMLPQLQVWLEHRICMTPIFLSVQRSCLKLGWTVSTTINIVVNTALPSTKTATILTCVKEKQACIFKLLAQYAKTKDTRTGFQFTSRCNLYLFRFLLAHLTLHFLHHSLLVVEVVVGLWRS